VQTTNAWMLGMVGLLAALTVKLGIPAMLCLYVVPYWVGVVWLDVVTYLHHHGSDKLEEKMPWYRGEEWTYLRCASLPLGSGGEGGGGGSCLVCRAL
jgi:omega-3 fatty acid desaturase (delta-15 desaturase)